MKQFFFSMQELISSWMLILSVLSVTRAQFFETSQPIENLLTRATIDKIPVGRSEPGAHHVLMELPILRVEPNDDYDFTEQPPPLFESTEKVNPYASSGIFSQEQRQHRFKSLRPSYPFARRRGGGPPDASSLATTTPEPSSTHGADQGLRSGNLRSRFRFRPSLRSSKRKGEEELEGIAITTLAPEASTLQSSPNNKFSFRRTGGVSDFIRRNRPGLRRKTTTTTTTTLPSTAPIQTTPPLPTTFLPRTTFAPTTVWIAATTTQKSNDLFDFDTPLSPFTKSVVRDRTELPFTTTQRASTIDIPKIQSTTTHKPQKSTIPTKGTTTNLIKRRRQRPRPAANIVPLSSEEEKSPSQEKNHPKGLQFRGKKIKGRRIRGNRRRRPQSSTTPKPEAEEVLETTTVQPKKFRRGRIPPRRQNARSDFDPSLLEEIPRRSSKIITQSSVKTERKILVPKEQKSEIVRRDNKIRLKTRKNRIRANEIERYSFEEDDGSLTWGYKTSDGSFKQETRGADCITRGRYGYIDDSGEIREYNYESGVPCKAEGEEDDGLGNLEARGVGYFDYSDNRFVLPDGRRVKVKINQKHRARG